MPCGRSLTLLRLFRSRSDSRLSFVDQFGVGDDSSRPWIGWNPDQRMQYLQFIVNNSRFLNLPWVQVKALASTILVRSARQLPHDWCQHYGYAPLRNLLSRHQLDCFGRNHRQMKNGSLPQITRDTQNGSSSFRCTDTSNTESVPPFPPLSHSPYRLTVNQYMYCYCRISADSSHS